MLLEKEVATHPVFLLLRNPMGHVSKGYSLGSQNTDNLATKQQRQLVTLVNWTSAVIQFRLTGSQPLQSPNCSQVLGSAVGFFPLLCGLSSLLVLDLPQEGGPSWEQSPGAGSFLPPKVLCLQIPSYPSAAASLSWAPCYHVRGSPTSSLPRQTTSKHHRAHQTKPLLQVNLLHQPSWM